MNPKAKATKQDSLPKWLIRVQQQSWEPEILISGIVLLALFQLPEKIQDLGAHVSKFSYPILTSGTTTQSLVISLQLSVYWLILGFGCHLLFRSVWVAFVGLSYAYPEGIRKVNLPYQEFYKRKIGQKENVTLIIKKLEKLCSSMFALSFLMSMMIMGIFFFGIIFVLFLLPVSQLYYNKSLFDGIGVLFNIILFFSIIDFLTLGGLKRIPYVSYLYYPIYWFVSKLTLSFLYRDIFYHFLSNHNKWKVWLFVVGFFSISIIYISAQRSSESIINGMEVSGISEERFFIDPNHYESLASAKVITTVRIQDEIITEDILKVFVAHNSKNEFRELYPTCLDEGGDDLSILKTDKQKLECLNKFYQLGINDSLIQSDYLYTTHPDTDQPGLKAYLDISDLRKGKNTLKLYYNFSVNDSIGIAPQLQAIVEFIKK